MLERPREHLGVVVEEEDVLRVDESHRAVAAAGAAEVPVEKLDGDARVVGGFLPERLARGRRGGVVDDESAPRQGRAVAQRPQRLANALRTVPRKNDCGDARRGLRAPGRARRPEALAPGRLEPRADAGGRRRRSRGGRARGGGGAARRGGRGEADHGKAAVEREGGDRGQLARARRGPLDGLSEERARDQDVGAVRPDEGVARERVQPFVQRRAGDGDVHVAGGSGPRAASRSVRNASRAPRPLRRQGAKSK